MVIALGAVACSGAEGGSGAVPVATSTASASAVATAAPSASVAPSASATARFDALAKRYLSAMLEHNPVRSTEIGYHAHDGKWPDLSSDAEASRRKELTAFAAELASLPEAELDRQASVDASILRNEIAYRLFALDELRDLERNPVTATYLVGDGLDPLLNRSFGTEKQRLADLASRLRGVPKLLEAAKKRLGAPPKLFTETAIAQNKGLVALVKTEIPERVKGAAEPERAAVLAGAREAEAALVAFGTYLERELLPRSQGDTRLGRERFEKKLRLELDDTLDVGSLAKSAEELLEKTHEEMLLTARELWPEVGKKKPLPKLGTPAEKRAFLKLVLGELAKDRPTNATIVAEAQKITADATAFVKKHDLVRVPDEPCRVIEMPEYRRGVAVAYCDSSGPLEEKRETFYAISPTPRDWSKERAESFYREYNRSMLVDLTVHEAMPGHFLQLAHNNDFPSKLRAVLASGSFVEGWAVYSEWLMAKHGFGGPKVRMMRQKMVLRLAMNAILDHGVHAGTLTEKEALRRMKEDAFQEEGEAVGKWRRANLTSAQLSTYFYGFSQLVRLRDKAEKRAGQKGLVERTYHDELLSFGSPAPRYLPRLMGLE